MSGLSFLDEDLYRSSASSAAGCSRNRPEPEAGERVEALLSVRVIRVREGRLLSEARQNDVSRGPWDLRALIEEDGGELLAENLLGALFVV